MDLHARQQFDFFFNAAIERFVDRIEQRCGGPVPALERLRTDPNGEGVWLDEFTAALFRDFLLDNAAGSAFVLQALSKRPAAPVITDGMTVEAALGALARNAFASVLRIKTDEQLEQRLAFQVVDE
ncbi:MAG: hypothetical protein IT355_16340 [Gemmatimonadaceae bacterium]|nr:hypothetical protein [Gemmatimonadaceae bacterium]